MAGAVLANPVAAGGSVLDLGGDGLKDILHVGPRGGIATGHDGGTEARAFFAARDAGADEEDAFCGEVFGAAVGVSEERVTAVDDNVAGFKVRQDMADHLINDVAGLDHQHDAARALEQADKVFDGVGSDDLRAFCFVGQEVVYLGDCAIEDGNLEAVVVHVEDKILSHDSEADQADITRCVWHRVSEIPLKWLVRVYWFTPLARKPPSTTSACPVTKDAASEAR